jgi:hypothetical protein
MDVRIRGQEAAQGKEAAKVKLALTNLNTNEL